MLLWKRRVGRNFKEGKDGILVGKKSTHPRAFVD
jgi:hypothetical protein